MSQPQLDLYFLGRANAPPTPFIVPGFQCFQGTDYNNRGTASGVGNAVNMFWSKTGIVFVTSGAPSGLTLASESSRTVLYSDPSSGSGAVDFVGGNWQTPGMTHQYHLLAWVKPTGHSGSFFPSEVAEFRLYDANSALIYYIAHETLNGNFAVQGRFAYNVSPSTNGTRDFPKTEVGPFNAWYLLSLEINEPAAVYRIRAYSQSGALLTTITTSVAVPAGARLRCDPGVLGFKLFNISSDAVEPCSFGKVYQAIGEVFNDAQIASIIAAGFG